MLHPDTELKFINTEIGYGVFATQFIPRGTITWVLDDLDLRIPATNIRTLPKLLQKQMECYAYINRYGQYILCWDFSKYMNHSCSSNSWNVGDTLQVAVRNIHIGEQLTCEYGIMNSMEEMTCSCGSENCRKFINTNICESLYSIWDQQVAEAWAVAGLVSQPLLPLAELNEDNSALLKALHTGDCTVIPSSRSYKFAL